jgi:poly(3-hydroxybutyrate) depolymerase
MTGAFQAQITAANLQRGYYVAIPTPYDPNVPHALVFGYHGSGYTGKMMRSYLDMEKAPLVSKAIYVYPDGLPPADNPSKAWDLTAAGMDMPFFDAMLAQMSADYCVDPKRVFVAGQSYGGLMTNAVGCFRGDVVRAIAAIAGSGPNNSSQCKGPVAAWITHGMDDDAVSFASGEKSRDFWVTKNGCTTTTAQGTPMQCQNYQGCMPGYPVIWCPHVNETGHQEPPWGRVAVREFFAGF